MRSLIRHRSPALWLAGIVACAAPGPSPADLSPADGKRVEGAQGMVAASHPDASAAGVEVLRAGGNAADAAVATAFALSVTDISQTGLGGGGALTFYNARTGRADHLSFYARTGSDPAWGTADSGAANPRRIGRAAAVPGMVAGLLEAHQRHGKLPRAAVLAPAIRLARDGFIVSPLLARTIASSRAKLQGNPVARALFFPDSQPLRPGARLVQPALATTLQRIADGGREAFYTGAIADQLARDAQALGGLITADDMTRYPVAPMVPLCTSWLGHTVLSAPPPMGGAPLLEMFELTEASGLTRAGGFTDRPQAVATMAGILRLAQADGSLHRGDPAVLAVPARGVTSAAYAAQRATLLAGAARDSVGPGDAWPHEPAARDAACEAYPYPVAVPRAPRASGDEPESQTNESLTSHLAVVDAEGNAVSATTTVGVLFGSGVYTGGFFLNSSAANLDARTRGPNRYSNSTIAPTVILDGRQVRLVIGAAGSQYIQPAIIQVSTRILAFGEDPGRAIAAPRIWSTPGRREVEVEPGFTTDVYAGLVAAGYQPLSRVADIQFGGVHGVFVRKDGRRIGIADPRRDGVARAQ
ncbi:MAG: gamma-glutamyltransferase [Gemmatimonadetes bacterium]|nr:gamma-glutamyltransferase [Gemmatimonadota bacterium]